VSEGEETYSSTRASPTPRRACIESCAGSRTGTLKVEKCVVNQQITGVSRNPAATNSEAIHYAA